MLWTITRTQKKIQILYCWTRTSTRYLLTWLKHSWSSYFSFFSKLSLHIRMFWLDVTTQRWLVIYENRWTQALENGCLEFSVWNKLRKEKNHNVKSRVLKFPSLLLFSRVDVIIQWLVYSRFTRLEFSHNAIFWHFFRQLKPWMKLVLEI